MYNCCRSRAKSKHFLSDPISITKGVHHGNVLCLLLFNVVIYDIGYAFNEIDVPVLHNSKIRQLGLSIYN